MGPSLAKDLRDLGYRRVEDLVGEDPEGMYARLAHIRGAHQDPCVLYVFRCAVYYASAPAPEPGLLKWWAWKGRELPPEMVAPPSSPSAGGEGARPQGRKPEKRG